MEINTSGALIPGYEIRVAAEADIEAIRRNRNLAFMDKASERTICPNLHDCGAAVVRMANHETVRHGLICKHSFCPEILGAFET